MLRLISPMAVSRYILIVFIILFSFSAYAGEKTGSVCLGPNLSVVLHDRDHVTISIGDIKGIRFEKDNSAKIVAKDLDLSKIYPVTVYYDGGAVESWTLDFKKLGSPMALIWRAKGAYKMTAAPKGRCTWP